MLRYQHVQRLQKTERSLWESWWAANLANLASKNERNQSFLDIERRKFEKNCWFWGLHHELHVSNDGTPKGWTSTFLNPMKIECQNLSFQSFCWRRSLEISRSSFLFASYSELVPSQGSLPARTALARPAKHEENNDGKLEKKYIQIKGFQEIVLAILSAQMLGSESMHMLDQVSCTGHTPGQLQ